MTDERNIVIVGGGFAGTTLARRLERMPLAGHRVVLVSEESTTTFHPMLAEVVGGAVFPEHVVAPIRQMLAASRFVMGRVTAVDWQRRVVVASTLAGRQEIVFAHLVFAFGTRANLELVPGLAEHALPLKLVGDALFIRNRVLQRVARVELESDPVLRRRLGHFVVVGGGFSGVEVAGQLADFLRGIRRYYPRVQAGELGVTLIEGADRLLLELPPSLGRAAFASLVQRGVDVRLGARAAGVDADGVRLVDGTTLASATVVCTIGTRPNPLVERLGVALARGRIVARADLSVPDRAGAWAIGDCALIGNGVAADDPAAGAPRDAIAPPTAQFAVAEANALAHNLVAQIAGRPTRAFRHVAKGAMATTGHLKGVAVLFGVRVSGLPAWLLWRAYYLLQMPTLGRKVRIWVEWTWAMFFAADITHLRFTRSAEADATQRGDAASPLATAGAAVPVTHP
jgi:NADH:quinone reductase (non-electrogenic)